MGQFLSEVQEKYTKIIKSANLIGFLNRLAVLRTLRTLTDSQPLDIYLNAFTEFFGLSFKKYIFKRLF